MNKDLEVQITKSRAEFELATKAFSLMTPLEQGLVLILFRNTKNAYIECFIDAVYKVVKNQNKVKEETNDR